MNHSPFHFNAAALCIIPISAINARSAEEQIDAIYAAADAPETDRMRATQLARLAGRLMRRIDA